MKKPIPFGKYVLLDRIRVGGMAEVFLAKAFGAAGFERILAIKKILPTMVEDEEFITMFIDEARIAVQLNHSAIVQIHELGKNDEHYYIAMEYVSGRDLRVILDQMKKRKRTLPLPLAVFVAQKVCEGLDYAHRKRDSHGQDLHIVHRDVSPQNVLVSFEGEVKIIDFGIAKAQGRLQKTQAGILKGKFGYMSPEQVRGLPVDRRSDIFALGVILYEMLTGERLFVGESDFSTLEKVRSAEVASARDFNAAIPEALDKVVLRALAREPEDRYQWASDLAEDLMRFLLSGDLVFGSKQLTAFMKDAFAVDLEREQERLARFSVPDPTGLTQTASNFAAGSDPAAKVPLAPAQVRAAPPILDLDSLSGPDGEPGVERTQLFQPNFSPWAVDPIAASVGGEASLPELAIVESLADVLRGERRDTADPAAAPSPVESTVIRSPQGAGVASMVSMPAVAEPSDGPAPEGATVIRAEPVARPLPGPGSRALPPSVRERTTDSGGAPVVVAPVAPSKAQVRRPLSPAALAGLGALAVAAVALVLFGLIGRRPRVPVVGTLVVYPHPAKGAHVEVDGRPLVEREHHAFVGSELPAGKHLLVAHDDSGHRREIQVEVKPGAVTPIDVMIAMPPPPKAPQAVSPSATPAVGSNLPPAAGEAVNGGPIVLTVVSDPPGAQVFIDRHGVGPAPYVLTGIDPHHRYRIKAVAPGRGPAERSGRFERSARLTLVLPEVTQGATPIVHHRAAIHGPPGTLIISSRPVAKVFIDGQSTGRYTPVPPSDPLELPSGDHLIHLESDDGKQADRQISVQPHALAKLINVLLN